MNLQYILPSVIAVPYQGGTKEGQNKCIFIQNLPRFVLIFGYLIGWCNFTYHPKTKVVEIASKEEQVAIGAATVRCFGVP